MAQWPLDSSFNYMLNSGLFVPNEHAGFACDTWTIHTWIMPSCQMVIAWMRLYGNSHRQMFPKILHLFGFHFFLAEKFAFLLLDKHYIVDSSRYSTEMCNFWLSNIKWLLLMGSKCIWIYHRRTPTVPVRQWQLSRWAHIFPSERLHYGTAKFGRAYCNTEPIHCPPKRKHHTLPMVKVFDEETQMTCHIINPLLNNAILIYYSGMCHSPMNRWRYHAVPNRKWVFFYSRPKCVWGVYKYAAGRHHHNSASTWCFCDCGYIWRQRWPYETKLVKHTTML